MKKNEGFFSNSLTSFQLQGATLMEDVGGEDACKLLDRVAELTPTERSVMLGTFTRVVEKFSTYGIRVANKSDQERQDFEDALFNDILSAMREAAVEQPKRTGSLAVLNGGKVRTPQRSGMTRTLRVVSNRKHSASSRSLH